MKKDLTKILLIAAFSIGVLSFTSIKKTTQNQFSKCVAFICNHTNSTIGLH